MSLAARIWFSFVDLCHFRLSADSPQLAWLINPAERTSVRRVQFYTLYEVYNIKVHANLNDDLLLYSYSAIIPNDPSSRTPEVEIHSSRDGRKCVIFRRKRYNWWAGKGYITTYTHQSSSDGGGKYKAHVVRVEKRRRAVLRPHS